VKCADCANWTAERSTIYSDGTVIVNFTAVDGGPCSFLNINTAPDFGCSKFKEGVNRFTKRKSGLPWQNWEMRPCPDCSGVGNMGTACYRCVGAGMVRFYDDGFIGDERTRMHPKEKEIPAASVNRCVNCNSRMDDDWVACPRCGFKLEQPAEPTVVRGVL